MNAQDELNQIEATLHQLAQERERATQHMGSQADQLQRAADKFEQTLQAASEKIDDQLDRLNKLADANQQAGAGLSDDIAGDQQAIDEPPDFDGQITALQDKIDDINRTTIPDQQQALQPLLNEQKDQRHQQALLQDKLKDIVAQENEIAIKIRKAKNLHDMIAITADEQGNIDDLRNEREDLTGQIDDIKATLQDGQADINDVNKQIEAARDQIKTWDTQRGQLEEAKRRRPAQVARLKSHIAQLEKRQEELSKMADAIDRQRQKAQDTQNTLSAQMAAIQPLLNVLSKDVAGMDTLDSTKTKPVSPAAAVSSRPAASKPAPSRYHRAPVIPLPSTPVPAAPTSNDATARPSRQVTPPAVPVTGQRPAAIVFPMLPKDPAHITMFRAVVNHLLQAGEHQFRLYTTAYEEEDQNRLKRLLDGLHIEVSALTWTNMYTALRQTDRPAAAPAQLNLQPDWHTQPTPDNSTVEYLDSHNQLMARVQYRTTGQVRLVTYFNPGEAERRDFWDLAGHIAVTQSINTATGHVTNENFYRTDGTVVLIKEYSEGGEHIHVLDEQRNVVQELDSDAALAAWWLGENLPADSNVIAEANAGLMLSTALQERSDLQLVPILTAATAPRLWAEILGGQLTIPAAYVSDANLLAAAQTTLPGIDVSTL
ncbi:hypothetical protein L248_2241 [Schleiferilactobacillus shenzhenensis LY-73]|uniref:Uncharacterized protein n=2 Tax=Schleiferilactobacillus shenzhenensis TaxID=1231337 RepID=U4TPA0_9LACO|nr:hypothetical protein L248_2241 [Schleiferilactobacillus shenzhenensis LY-73]